MGEFVTALDIGMDANKKLYIVKHDDENTAMYHKDVDPTSPQCIPIDSEIGMDKVFDEKITGWIEEINSIFGMDYSSVVFKGKFLCCI